MSSKHCPTLPALVFSLFAWPMSAFASSPGAAIIYVEGAHASSITQRLSDSLMSGGLDILDSAALATALHDGGLQGRLGEVAGALVGDVVRPSAVAVYGVSGADVAIIAHVNRARRSRQTARLLVVQALDGAILHDATVTVAKATRRRRRLRVDTRSLVAAVDHALRQRRDAPPAFAVSDASENEVAAASIMPGDPTIVESGAATRRRRSDRSPWLIVGAGFNVSGRFLSLGEAQKQSLREYRGFGIPGIRIDAAIFPLRLLSDSSAVGGFGVEGMVRQSFGARARAAGQVVGSSARDWRLGVAYQLGLGRLALRASVSFAQLAFQFDAPSGMASADALPSVEYNSLRPAVAVSLNLTHVSFEAQGGALVLIGNGASETQMSSVGFDAGLTVAVPAFLEIEVTVAGRYQSFGLAAAGTSGGTDHYLGVSAGLRRAF